MSRPQSAPANRGALSPRQAYVVRLNSARARSTRPPSTRPIPPAEQARVLHISSLDGGARPASARRQPAGQQQPEGVRIRPASSPTRRHSPIRWRDAWWAERGHPASDVRTGVHPTRGAHTDAAGQAPAALIEAAGSEAGSQAGSDGCAALDPRSFAVSLAGPVAATDETAWAEGTDAAEAAAGAAGAAHTLRPGSARRAGSAGRLTARPELRRPASAATSGRGEPRGPRSPARVDRWVSGSPRSDALAWIASEQARARSRANDGGAGAAAAASIAAAAAAAGTPVPPAPPRSFGAPAAAAASALAEAVEVGLGAELRAIAKTLEQQRPTVEGCRCVPPLCLPCVSPASPLRLPCVSPASPLRLPSKLKPNLPLHRASLRVLGAVAPLAGGLSPLIGRIMFEVAVAAGADDAASALAVRYLGGAARFPRRSASPNVSPNASPPGPQPRSSLGGAAGRDRRNRLVSDSAITDSVALVPPAPLDDECAQGVPYGGGRSGSVRWASGFGEVEG